jgi:flagellar basal-body rod protein FlgB
VSLFDITHVALERALSGASLRQRTLGENLANANVPGYQRRDVDFHSTLQRAIGGGTPALERTGFAAEQTGEGAMRPDGGTVDPDREATLLAQNAMEYEALAAVVKGRSAILRTAIGGR